MPDADLLAPKSIFSLLQSLQHSGISAGPTDLIAKTCVESAKVGDLEYHA